VPVAVAVAVAVPVALSTRLEDREWLWAKSVDETSAAHVRLCAGRPGRWCVLTFLRGAKVSGQIASCVIPHVVLWQACRPCLPTSLVAASVRGPSL
jgi:hypothetical protein